MRKICLFREDPFYIAVVLVSVVNVAGRGCLERKYKSTLNGLMGGEQKWRETKKKHTKVLENKRQKIDEGLRNRGSTFALWRKWRKRWECEGKKKLKVSRLAFHQKGRWECE